MGLRLSGQRRIGGLRPWGAPWLVAWRRPGCGSGGFFGRWTGNVGPLGGGQGGAVRDPDLTGGAAVRAKARGQRRTDGTGHSSGGSNGGRGCPGREAAAHHPGRPVDVRDLAVKRGRRRRGRNLHRWQRARRVASARCAVDCRCRDGPLRERCRSGARGGGRGRARLCRSPRGGGATGVALERRRAGTGRRG